MAKYADIFAAVRANDIKAVKTFLPDGLNAKNKYDRTPLHIACNYCRVAIVRLLLDNGADIKARDNQGRTPLYWACCNNRHKTSELLVRRGADPLVKDNNGKIPLDWDTATVKDKYGNAVPHRQILLQLRADYLNKHALEASKRTAALSSGWEMEM